MRWVMNGNQWWSSYEQRHKANLSRRLSGENVMSEPVETFPFAVDLRALAHKNNERKTKAKTTRERKAMPALLAIIQEDILKSARAGAYTAPLSKVAFKNTELTRFLFRQGFTLIQGLNGIEVSWRSN